MLRPTILTARLIRDSSPPEATRASGPGAVPALALTLICSPVSPRAEGDSAGRVGLVMTRTQPADGGELDSGLPARAELDAGKSDQRVGW